MAHCWTCNGQLSYAYAHYCNHMCEWLSKNLTQEQKTDMLKFIADGRARNAAEEERRKKQRQDEADVANFERLKQKFRS